MYCQFLYAIRNHLCPKNMSSALSAAGVLLIHDFVSLMTLPSAHFNRPSQYHSMIHEKAHKLLRSHFLWIATSIPVVSAFHASELPKHRCHIEDLPCLCYGHCTFWCKLWTPPRKNIKCFLNP